MAIKTMKALIFDLDGTAIPNRPDAMPSKGTIEAVKKAKNKVSVSIATARPYASSKDILKALRLDTPCILNGGAQLYNPITRKDIWKQYLDERKINEIVSTLKNLDTDPYDIIDDFFDRRFKINSYVPPKSTGLLCVFAVPENHSHTIKAQLDMIPEIEVHLVHSWVPGTFDIHIGHHLATKKHAMQVFLDWAGISPAETMAVGDSNNDMPLFELAGIKVAMGNGSDELKSKATWIAPSVDDDGLAAAIEKYIL